MLEFWPVVLTVSGAAASLSFARAIRGHFVSETLPSGMKMIVALSYLAIFVYFVTLWTGDAPAWARAAGLLLQGVGAALFHWAKAATQDNRLTAAFDVDAPQFLMRTGPYRFVRHPFYAAYIAFWLGSAAGAGSWVLWLIVLVLAALYVIAARREEQKFENSGLAEDYRSYARRTGFLLPKFAALAKTPAD